MKKLFVIMLVFTMIFGMSGAAFADDYTDSTQVKIDKELTVNGGVNPAEAFNFTIGAGSVTEGSAASAPTFTPATFTINVAQGGTTGSSNINLPTFTQVGKYTYPITETAGSTAGMVYDTTTKNLVVTVINNPNGEGFLRVLTLTNGNNVKDDAFKNTFNAGDLTIKKEITGNYADPDDEFTITLTVTPNGNKVINANPIVWNTTDVSSANGVYTAIYTLKGGEDVTIENLPYDVTYTVVETDSGEYTASYDDNKEGAINAATIETTITNNREIEVPVGVNLDNLPYIIILMGAVGGLAIFTIRRRLVK